MSRFTGLVLFLLITSSASAQVISASLPQQLSKNEKYLFYLHGGVVTELGDNAVSQAMPEWGPYEYSNILDSLQKRGFNVISEMRKKEVDNSFYVDKISKQADSLLNAGIPVNNIVFVGASAGWEIVVHVSSKLKNNNLHFVIMGGCWPDTHTYFSNIKLYGRFLSIIESTDPHGTCFKLFEGRKTLSSHKEITLHTGLSHGFIYKGYKEWIDPVVDWLD